MLTGRSVFSRTQNSKIFFGETDLCIFPKIWGLWEKSLLCTLKWFSVIFPLCLFYCPRAFATHILYTYFDGGKEIKIKTRFLSHLFLEDMCYFLRRPTHNSFPQSSSPFRLFFALRGWRIIWEDGRTRAWLRGRIRQTFLFRQNKEIRASYFQNRKGEKLKENPSILLLTGEFRYEVPGDFNDSDAHSCMLQRNPLSPQKQERKKLEVSSSSIEKKYISLGTFRFRAWWRR